MVVPVLFSQHGYSEIPCDSIGRTQISLFAEAVNSVSCSEGESLSLVSQVGSVMWLEYSKCIQQTELVAGFKLTSDKFLTTGISLAKELQQAAPRTEFQFDFQLNYLAVHSSATDILCDTKYFPLWQLLPLQSKGSFDCFSTLLVDGAFFLVG